MKNWVSSFKKKLNKMANFGNSPKKLVVYGKLFVLMLLAVLDWFKNLEFVSNNKMYKSFNSNCKTKPKKKDSSDAFYDNCLYSYDEESHGDYED